MKPSVKRKIREAFAGNRIKSPIILNRKLLRSQINTISSLTAITNDEIGDCLTGVLQVVELFEWLPKGEYTIKIKIE